MQVYLARPDTKVERPVRWLAAHAVVRAQPGDSTTVELAVPARAFSHWDNGWQWETGDFELHVGSSAVDLPLRTTVSCVPSR